MKIIVRPVFLAANFFLIVLALLHHTPVFQPALAPPTPDKPERLSQAEAAFRKKINIQAESVAAYLLYSTHLDDLALSNDGDWATAQLSPVDTQTNQVVPAEPGLAVAHLDGGSWQAFLPGDSGWVQAVKAAPDSLLSAQAKTYWLELDLQQSQSPAVGPYRGYLLPWAGGTTLFMTQSVHHDAYTPSGSAHYAFDFAAPWEPGANSSPMFNIYAAKAGTVKMFYDGWENGHYNPNNPNEVNYLVLEDMTTTPTTYQLYLHLAQDSIAPKLKQVGAPAQQGEFLAVADDTGVSSGNHLHFQVHTNPNSYYSTSVDITFDDVAINGGRPRNSQDLPYCHPDDVCNQTSDRYTSGNTIKGDVTPPTGDLLQPAATGASIHSSHLSLEGWAYDQGSGLKSAQFIANFGGAWHEIGDSFTNSPFSMDWDLCADQVPDGPVSVALRLKDNSGNLSLDLPGLRHLVKNYACAPPPPACSPGANQAALYADSSYGGACVLLDTGVYTSPVDFGLVGPKNTASILLGSNAQATLYMNSDLTGRGETFQADDSNLQDNLIGTDNVSSVKVQVRSNPPAVPTPLWPEAGASFSAGDSLSLVWGNAGASEQFRARLVVAGQTLTSSWRKEPFWHLGSLASGSYTWQVQSGNGGGESAWSSPRNLLVSPLPPASTTSYTAPYSDNMENGDNGWQNSSYWDQTNLQNHTSGGKASWVYDTNSAHGYDTGEPNSGDLTSPPIHIPDTGYYLRFWYRYETESQGTHWDQRWLQISADGGPFTNTLQLSDDPDNYWLHSPAVDLSVYSGKTIQTRFHFETLDAAFNDFQGWFIDDFDISQAAPPNCGDTNNSPAQATPVSYGSSVPALICPAGDKDYYRFTGKAGDQVGISVDATSTTSPLDPILFVLDSDQSSVLAENDDLVAFKLTNSFTSLRLPHDGVYTILVRAWNHPSRGDEKATYTLRLFSEKQLPTASIAFPPSGIFLPNNPFTITVNAADADSGVSHVVFSLHSSNWLSSDWTQIGEDWDGSDGWQLPYDPSQLAEQKDIAFFASVYDKAGNFSGAGAWSLAIDRTPPVSAIQPMSATQQSTAILVQWTGEDNISGIDHFDLQSQIDNGTWKDQLKNIPAVDRQAWVIAEAGHQYGFRMRAVDRLGNVENYPQAAEASTTVPADVCSGPDEWENDNQPASANTVSSNSAPQRHTYCNPEAGTNWLHDEDWLKVTAMTGETIWVASIPQSGAAASVLELYDSNLVTPTLLAETIPIDIGAATQLKWRLEQDGTYYLRLHNPDESVAGDGVIYKVWVRKGQLLYLPLIHTRP